VLQRNDVPPDDVSIAESPTQIESAEVILQTGAGLIVTMVEHELEQPSASVTVTV